MELQTRKRVGILIRIGLILATFAFVGAWFVRRIPQRPEFVSVQREAPPAAALGPGDLQIISTDGSIDLILKGDKVMGGLSPAMVAKVRAEMEKEKGGDSTGFGAMISGMVKSGVASAIGTHITYPVAEITDLYFKDGVAVFKTRSSGDKEQRFGDIKTDGKKEPARFSEEDAKRFVEAYRARRLELAGLKP